MFKKIKSLFKKQNVNDLNKKIESLEERMQQIEEINANILQEVLSFLKNKKKTQVLNNVNNDEKSSKYH